MEGGRSRWSVVSAGCLRVKCFKASARENRVSISDVALEQKASRIFQGYLSAVSLTWVCGLSTATSRMLKSSDAAQSCLRKRKSLLSVADFLGRG